MSNQQIQLNLSKLGTASADGVSLAEPVSTPQGPEEMKDTVVEVLRTVYDPEIPVNIFELGLVYDLEVTPALGVHVRMTLTSPACPVAGSLPGEVESKIKAIPGVTGAKVELVWDPPWDKDRMSEAAQLQLGFF